MKFLLEIGLEELPARFILPASKQLAELMEEMLAEARIGFSGFDVYSSPRRLALKINDIAERQEDLAQEVKGPPKNIAYKDGQPTKALEGFARSQGVGVDDLFVKTLGNAEYLFANKFVKGLPTKEVLAEMLPKVITGLSFPKNMRWGDCELRYARPLRWAVALLDQEVVPFTIENVVSGNTSYGHRQLSQGRVTIEHPDKYLETLKSVYVIADFDLRREIIRKQVDNLAAQIGGKVLPDEALLDEVTNLVEYPTAFLGSFPEEYLDIPMEVLVTSMKEHQRYFPVFAQDGKLLPRFIGVRNGADNQLDLVTAGNEKVLNARLADAKFFYEEDSKQPLENYVERLKSVVFQDGLGTIYDKVNRIINNAKALCQLLDKEGDQELVVRTAALCKADLVTNMVFEFPELQGVMGSKYALLSGEDPQVAVGIKEHYLPRFSQDEVPETTPGIIVSLADKLDTLVGYFGLGRIPTGSQDPFALRRQALGVVQIVLANNIDIELKQLLETALASYGTLFEDQADAIVNSLLEFFAGRIRVNLLEQGYSHDSIDAVTAVGLTSIPAVKAKIAVLDEFREDSTFSDLHTAFERSYKIAAKYDPETVNPEHFTEADRELAAALEQVEAAVHKNLGSGKYKESLQSLASLRQPIDAFFDAVMIMDPDAEIRANRLGLLQKVISLFNTYADFSLIVV